MKKIFISQLVLDRLFAEGRADLMGEKLTVKGKDIQTYAVAQAFKFLAVADGSPDKAGMVGKIYAKAELDKIKADLYMDSAIISDVPYTIEPGYIGMPENVEAQAVTRAAEEEKVKKAEPETKVEGADDHAMLADYLLKIL
jgi:hypothetical protein